MLSRILLRFDDSDMRNRYAAEKIDFYKKAIPVICSMMMILSITFEVVYRAKNYGDITILTSCINWGCFLSFLILSITVRYLWWTSWFVCPILTCLIYYYFAFVDYERTSGIVYFR